MIEFYYNCSILIFGKRIRFNHNENRYLTGIYIYITKMKDWMNVKPKFTWGVIGLDFQALYKGSSWIPSKLTCIDQDYITRPAASARLKNKTNLPAPPPPSASKEAMALAFRCLVILFSSTLNSWQVVKVAGGSTPNYRDALAKSLLFFQGQRSGRLPRTQQIDWRSASGLSDGSFARVRTSN